MTDDPLSCFVLFLHSVKGPEGQRGPAGTRVSLLSVAASLLLFSGRNICENLNLTSFHFCYFQGDRGERGAPGEKV